MFETLRREAKDLAFTFLGIGDHRSPFTQEEAGFFQFLIPAAIGALGSILNRKNKANQANAAAQANYDQEKWNYETNVRPQIEARNRSETAKNALRSSLAKGMGLEGLYGGDQISQWDTPLKTPDYMAYHKPETGGAFGYLGDALGAGVNNYVGAGGTFSRSKSSKFMGPTDEELGR